MTGAGCPDGDAGKAALLDLACDIKGRAPLTRLRDKIEGEQRSRHLKPRRRSQSGSAKFN